MVRCSGASLGSNYISIYILMKSVLYSRTYLDLMILQNQETNEKKRILNGITTKEIGYPHPKTLILS